VLLSESIALGHQTAVLERSRTDRPCFRRFDRLFLDLDAALVVGLARNPSDRPGPDRLALAP
jgi:hypothetical protein